MNDIDKCYNNRKLQYQLNSVQQKNVILVALRIPAKRFHKGTGFDSRVMHRNAQDRCIGVSVIQAT